MAYLSKNQEPDTPWLAAGFLATSVLFISAPACLDPKWAATPLLKTGCSFLSVGFGIASTLLYRRIRYYLYPQWLRNRDYESSLQEDLAALTLKNELSKHAAIMVAQTRTELEEQFPNNPQRALESGDEEPRIKPPQTTNDCAREVERLWSELATDQQKQVLKNLEKTLDAAPDKGFSDLDGADIPSKNTSENPLDIQGIQAQVEQVRTLVQLGGLKLSDAVKKVSGFPSNHRAYRELRDAYKAKYGEEG